MTSDATAETTDSTVRFLFRHPPFLFFWSARVFSSISFQISAVAVGWQIYSLTHSAFKLGLVGLVQFLPMAALTFVAGHTADRYDRRNIVRICQVVHCLAAVFLAVGSFGHWITPAGIYAAVSLMGCAKAFESPASASLLPGVVPVGFLQSATAVSSSAMQTATILGPALGGFLYAIAPGAPYAVMAVLWICSSTLNGLIKMDRVVPPREPVTLSSLFAGVRFVWSHQAVLGTISLDLFAVLLGGATALLPIYAQDILHTGPWGLGVLRAAPAVGALTMSAALARRTLNRKVGLRMLQAVIVFGFATVVFAVSRSFPLSLVALAAMGAADVVSVVIRLSLVQLSTPDEMRGRVSAVNFLFINASNQLGEFESGVTAAFFGVVPAAVIGGVGSIMIALLWMKLFPDLRNVERLEG